MDAVSGCSTRRAAWCAGVLALGTGAAGARAQAQPDASDPAAQPGETTPAPVPSEDRAVHFEFRFQGDLGFNADLDGSPGDLTASRAGGGIAAEIPTGDNATLYLGYDYALTDFDFSGATGLIPGTDDPWGSIHGHNLNAMFLHKASEKWTWLVGGDLLWSAEEGADSSEGMAGLVYGSVVYIVSPSLTVGLGGGLRSRLEDSALFVPLASVNWSFAEHWRLRTIGPGLALEYAPDDQWLFSLSGRYDMQDFRLSDDGPAPGGVGRDERVPISVAAEYTPTRALTVSARVGVNLLANLEALDANGTSLGETDVDPAPFVTLWCKVRF